MKRKPIEIAAYTHPLATPTTQQPDLSPGNYYVSVRDGERMNVLAGPFVNDHAAALGCRRGGSCRSLPARLVGSILWLRHGQDG